MVPATPDTYSEHGSAELCRLLTHSSNSKVWMEECTTFYEHLRNRGYPVKAIDSSFREVNWMQCEKLLELKANKTGGGAFLAQYRG